MNPHPNHRKRNRRNRTGAATVEFALTSALLFAFLFGGIEITRLYTLHSTLENAAYEGCRHAVLPGADDEQVKDQVMNYLASAGVIGDRVDVNSTIDRVTVTARIEISRNSWGVSYWAVGQYLTATCELTKELTTTITN